MSYVKIGDITIGSNKRFMLTAVENSSSGQVSRREIVYAGRDGNSFSDITFKSRTVTVKGVLFGDSKDDAESLKYKLTEACNPKNETAIYYHNGVKEYYALAYPSELPVYSKINNYTYSFSVYLDLKDFYWLSSSDIVEGIFSVTPNLYGDFSLPRAFTIRTQGADIYNNGSIAVPPVFHLNILSQFTDDIIINNVTYGQFIKIEQYTAAVDEIITIDCDNFNAVSSVQGNIIKYISDDSVFFNFEVGYNRIECALSTLTANTRYRERFLGV